MCCCIIDLDIGVFWLYIKSLFGYEHCSILNNNIRVCIYLNNLNARAIFLCYLTLFFYNFKMVVIATLSIVVTQMK